MIPSQRTGFVLIYNIKRRNVSSGRRFRSIYFEYDLFTLPPNRIIRTDCPDLCYLLFRFFPNPALPQTFGAHPIGLVGHDPLHQAWTHALSQVTRTQPSPISMPPRCAAAPTAASPHQLPFAHAPSLHPLASPTAGRCSDRRPRPVSRARQSRHHRRSDAV
jgi:hypothetical protein